VETLVPSAGNYSFLLRKLQFPAEGTAVSKARNYEETVIDYITNSKQILL